MEILNAYFWTLFHPWHMHRHFQKRGEGMMLFEKPLHHLELKEVLLVSWIFVFMKGIIDFAAILLKVSWAQILFKNTMPAVYDLLGSNWQGALVQVSTFKSIAVEVLAFPVALVLTYFLWLGLFKLFFLFLDYVPSHNYFQGLSHEALIKQRNAIIKDIIVFALTSQFFVFIPLIGNLISALAFFFLMYVGMKVRLDLRTRDMIFFFGVPVIFIYGILFLVTIAGLLLN
ncbi:MAG: hypothetical protein ACOCUH_04375 [Bacteriovoracia bacterium]